LVKTGKNISGKKLVNAAKHVKKLLRNTRNTPKNAPNAKKAKPVTNAVN
jgi:hypothetical protein